MTSTVLRICTMHIQYTSTQNWCNIQHTVLVCCPFLVIYFISITSSLLKTQWSFLFGLYLLVSKLSVQTFSSFIFLLTQVLNFPSMCLFCLTIFLSKAFLSVSPLLYNNEVIVRRMVQINTMMKTLKLLGIGLCHDGDCRWVQTLWTATLCFILHDIGNRFQAVAISRLVKVISGYSRG